MEKRRLESIRVQVKAGKQQSPDEDIEHDIEYKNDDAYCFKASESIRD